MSEVKLPEKMLGMKLPGGAKVEAVEVDVPKPGPGQVLLKMKAASLCGSDLKYIYYENPEDEYMYFHPLPCTLPMHRLSASHTHVVPDSDS